MPVRQERRAFAVRLASGLVLGFSIVAVAQALGVIFTLPLPSTGAGMRAAHLVAAAAESVGVGAVAFALPIFLWLWFVNTPYWLDVILLSVIAALAMVPVASVEIYRQACTTVDNVRLEAALYVVYQFGNGIIASLIPLGFGLFFARLRWLISGPLLIAAVLYMGDQWLFRDDYVSVHGTVTVGVAFLVAGTLAPHAEALYRRLRTSAWGRRALLGLALFGAAGVLLPPPDRLRCELFRDPCTFAPWLLAASLWRAPEPVPSTPTRASPWLGPSEQRKDTPPTSRALMSKPPVVVLVTIDATRAEAINDPANDGAFPNIARLKATGTTFLHATAPGSQTAVSLSTLFSGKPYTALRWAYAGEGVMRFHYPAIDTSVRFPELLNQHGVHTAAVSSVVFQGEEYGVVRGFTEHRVVVHGRNHAYAKQVVEPALDMLRRAGDGPFFLHFHLMEPHAPYDRGTHRGSDYVRYLSEIAAADREIGRVIRYVDQRFADRAVFIVSADHGEAFGEHQTTGHSKTLYQELLAVPLVVRTPDSVPREVDERVALADLGPTILDLFGIPVPSAFVGQSLVPLLEDESVKLDRPILAEGRLRRALIRPDGMKIIDDPRRKIVEAYDLEADPGELHNLFGLDPRADQGLVALRTFFANHEIAAHDSSYSPPYKP